MSWLCRTCGKDKRLRSAKSGQCSACYMRGNRVKSPDAYERHKAAVVKYQKANPEKRHRWVTNYRLSHGQQIPPEVHELRKAVKRLEKALAATT